MSAIKKTFRPKSRAFVFPSNIYVVEGKSSVFDYLRLRPKAVKAVIAKTTADMKVVTAFAKDQGLLSLPASPLEDWLKQESLTSPDDAPSKAPVWALVAVEVVGENQLWERLEREEDRLILALDHITDPRNLGALARTAAFFGVKHILVPRDRQVLLTPAAVNTSQGAFAHTDLVVVTNLVRTIEKLKDCNYWIIGAGPKGDDLSYLARRYDKNVLVLGNEELGLSALMRKKCDHFVRVDGAKTLDSLNVSVAGGILIHSLS